MVIDCLGLVSGRDEPSAEKIASMRSEVLVLGLPTQEGGIALLAPDRDVPLGGRVF
jgi:tRNA-binding protein